MHTIQSVEGALEGWAWPPTARGLCVQGQRRFCVLATTAAGTLTPPSECCDTRLSEVARHGFGYQPGNPCLHLCTHSQTLAVGRALRKIHLIDLEEVPERQEYAWSAPNSFSTPLSATICAMLFTGALALASGPWFVGGMDG